MPDPPASDLDLVMRQVRRSGRQQVAEFQVPTGSGERHVDMRITPELRADGSVQSLMTISRDLTEQRQAEAERADLYREIVAQLDVSDRTQAAVRAVELGIAQPD